MEAVNPVGTTGFLAKRIAVGKATLAVSLAGREIPAGSDDGARRCGSAAVYPAVGRVLHFPSKKLRFRHRVPLTSSVERVQADFFNYRHTTMGAAMAPSLSRADVAVIPAAFGIWRQLTDSRHRTRNTRRSTASMSLLSQTE